MALWDEEQEYKFNHEPDSKEDYEGQALQQCENFINEMYDIAGRYAGSICGDMETQGTIQYGPGHAMRGVLNKLDLLKQSLQK